MPDLDRRHPHLAAVIQRLRVEHRTVARARGELEQLLGDITTADPDRFRAELERMSAELAPHLDFEEEHRIPVLAVVPLPPGPPAPAPADQ